MGKSGTARVHIIVLLYYTHAFSRACNLFGRYFTIVLTPRDDCLKVRYYREAVKIGEGPPREKLLVHYPCKVSFCVVDYRKEVPKDFHG